VSDETIIIEIFQHDNGMFFLRDKLTGEIVGKERLSQLGSWLYREAKRKETEYEERR